MAIADAQGALFTGAKTFLTGEGLAAGSIAWPNAKFNPEGKNVWAEIHYVPNPLVPVSAGGEGVDRGTGFLQIGVAVPVNTEDGTLRTWENAAYNFFPPGKTFTQNGQVVQVTSFSGSQIRKVDNWCKKSFTIVYRFDINRPPIT